MKKHFISLLIGGVSLSAIAQNEIPDQHLAPAEITGQLDQFNIDPHAIDSSTLKLADSQSLGQMLAAQGWGNLSLYGPPGTSALARTAGLSADHTSVNWNGMPVESPTLGSTDLSLIPVFLLSGVTLADGGAFNQGSSFGGSIHLNSFVDQGSSASLFAEYSTLGNIQGGVKGSYDLGKFKGRTGIQYGQFNNDFDMLIADESTRQENNNVDQLALSQDLSFSVDEQNELYASALWIQRQAQVPFLRNSLGLIAQDQADSSMKVVAGWKHTGERIATDVKWGSAVEKQDYTYSYTWDGFVFDELSEIRTARNMVDASFVCYVEEGVKIAGGGRSTDIRATTSSFAQNHNAQVLNAFAMAEWQNDWVNLRVNARHDINSHADDGTAFDAVLSRAFESDVITVRPEVVISRKFRAPDMNELYWSPGGNEDLLSENGWSYTAGAGVLIDKGVRVRASSKYTRMQIDNMIQWVPEGWVWTVQNFSSVAIDWVKSEVEIQRGNHTLSIQHEFTENVFTHDDGTTGRTLYVPKHQLCGAFAATVSEVELELSALVREGVITQSGDDLADRSDFALLNFAASRAFNISSSVLTLRLGVDNILDRQVEFIQFAAMPGRVIRFGLGWTLQK